MVDALHTRSCDKREDGFTLFEISIVLIIIAVVISGGMTIFASSLQTRQLKETQSKLAAIQDAIYNYRIVNNRIPCPADALQAMNATSSNNFGVEASTPGDCYITGAIRANFSNGNYVEGMVPTVTLRLPDEYAIDGWGRRIMYAVDNRFTATGALAIYSTYAGPMAGVTNGTTNVTGITSTSGILANMGIVGSGIPPADTVASVGVGTLTLSVAATTSVAANTLTFYSSQLPAAYIPINDSGVTRLTVNDASGHTKTTAAAYVLISFGPDGFGAYPRGSGTSNLIINTSRIDTLSTNADQKNNCDCQDSAGSIAATGLDGVFVQKTATQDYTTTNHTNDFNDIVLFGTRQDLHSPAE